MEKYYFDILLYTSSFIPVPFTVVILTDGACTRYLRSLEINTSKLRD